MLFTSLKGIINISLTVAVLILLIFLIIYLKYKSTKSPIMKWQFIFIIWVQSVIAYSFFKWYIAFAIILILFICEVLYFKKTCVEKNQQKAGLKLMVSLFGATLICLWLPLIYELFLTSIYLFIIQIMHYHTYTV